MKSLIYFIFIISFSSYSYEFLDGHWIGEGSITTKTSYGELTNPCSDVVVSIIHEKKKIQVLQIDFECKGGITKSLEPVVLEVAKSDDVLYDSMKVGKIDGTTLNISLTDPLTNRKIDFFVERRGRDKIYIRQVEESYFNSQIITEAFLTLDYSGQTP